MGVAGSAGTHGTYRLTARWRCRRRQTSAKIQRFGVKVGQVAKISIDPKDLHGGDRAGGEFRRGPAERLSAKITSDGLLGGAHVALTPGGPRTTSSPVARSPTPQARSTCSG